MARRLKLRQIEAFKAVIENGSISRAAILSNISQPGMSKLIAHLEADTGLKLFDRVKGRIAPTEYAMLLYQEVDRIFSGVRQVEDAVDAIRRAEQGRLVIGVLPALNGSFIQRVTTSFLQSHQGVSCTVQSLSSPWTVDWLIARKLDIGLVSGRIDNPRITLEPLMEHPLVCIMPPGHPLARKREIAPDDLCHVPFVRFHPTDSYVGRLVDEMLEKSNVECETAVLASSSPTVCEFVAAGLGISLVHPLMISGLENRLAVRPFALEIPYSFQICRSADDRNARLIDTYANELREVSARISQSTFQTL